MSREIRNTIQRCFRIDYMGAAEFEFGALQRSWGELLRSDLEAGSVTVDSTANWKRRLERQSKKKGGLPPVFIGAPTDLWIICRQGEREEVRSRLQRIIDGTLRLKMPSLLPESMDPIDPRDKEMIGWYELSNGWFAFLDKEAWQKTCKLFLVRPPDVQPKT